MLKAGQNFDEVMYRKYDMCSGSQTNKWIKRKTGGYSLHDLSTHHKDTVLPIPHAQTE